MQKSERIVSYTQDELEEMIRRGEDRTDFAAIDALTEEELEASIDLEEEGEPLWDTIQVGLPLPKQQLTVRLDAEVLAFFKSGGPGYQTRINAVLRSYVEAQRQKAS
ncbi:MAG: BrnA antitoxin family protein [Thermomicrobiales bacterium]